MTLLVLRFVSLLNVFGFYLVFIISAHTKNTTLVVPALLSTPQTSPYS